jgi:hypothetical protein
MMMSGVTIWNAFKRSLYLMPAGWLVMEINIKLPRRKGWSNAM